MLEGSRGCVVVTRRSPLRDIVLHLRFDRGVHAQDDLLARKRRLRGLGEDVDADDLEVALFDAAGAVSLGPDEAALDLLDGLEGTAESEDIVELRLRSIDQLV